MKNSLECTKQCPNCNYDMSVNLITSLSMDDKAIEDLFNGSLNVVLCEQCHISFLCESSLIFRDYDQNYYVYYMPNQENVSLNKLLDQMETAIKVSFDLPKDNFPNLRLTLSRQSFMEKIALHLEELDDKVIEYMKFQMFNSENNLNRENEDLFYDFSKNDKNMLYFTIFNKEERKPRSELNIGKNVYEQICQLNESEKSLDLDAIFPNYLVDQNYLKRK